MSSKVAALLAIASLSSCALFQPAVVEVEVPIYVDCECCLPPLPTIERVLPADPHAAACYTLDDADILAGYLESLYLRHPVCASGD